MSGLDSYDGDGGHVCAGCLPEYNREPGLPEQDWGNPVFYKAVPDEYGPAGWYFWDETWTDALGAWATCAQAEEALEEYAALLMHGTRPIGELARMYDLEFRTYGNVKEVTQ